MTRDETEKYNRWLTEVIFEMQRQWNMDIAEIEKYMRDATGMDTWRALYDQGLTPEQALYAGECDPQ